MTKDLPRVIDASTGIVVVGRLELAVTFGRRLLGLQFRREFLSGNGLLLAPCPSVHSCFLRFPIDVVWLDRQGTVVDLTRSLRPWRIAKPSRKAWAALEVPASTDLPAVGTRLRIVGAGAAALPRSLSEWVE